MKLPFLLCLLSMLFWSVISSAQTVYSVHLKGKGFPRQKVKLVKVHRISETIDSAYIESEVDITLGRQPESQPVWYELRFENPNRVIQLMSDQNPTVVVDWQQFSRFDLSSLPFQVVGSPATKSIYELDQWTGVFYNKLINLKNRRDSASYVQNAKLEESNQTMIVQTTNQMVDALLHIVDTTQFVATASRPFYALLSINQTYELQRIEAIAQAFDRVSRKYKDYTYFQLTREGIAPQINIAKNPKKEEQQLKGAQLPVLHLLTADGKTIKQLPLRKRYAFVDLWASWCEPCRAEIPASLTLAKEFSQYIDFVYISVDDKPEQWQKALSQVKLAGYSQTFLLTMPTKKAFVEQLQIQFIPRYLIVDNSGRIIESYARRPSDPLLKAQLLKLAK